LESMAHPLALVGGDAIPTFANINGVILGAAG
jgi:hypothetical protein